MTAARRWAAAALSVALDLLAALLDRLDPPCGQHAPMVPAAASADSGGGPAPARHAPPWQPGAAPAPPARHAPSPISPGEGAPPGRDTWVITQPPPGSPLGWTPVARGRHPYPPLAYTRPDGFIVLGPDGCVSVLPEPQVIPPADPTYPGDPGYPDLVRPYYAAWERRLAEDPDRPVDYWPAVYPGPAS